MVYESSYNDVNVTRVVIGRCPWSIRVQIHGWRHAKLVFFVLFNMARGFENFYEIISDYSKWSYTRKKNGETGTKRALDYLRMHKLQEVFTTAADRVSSLDYRYETLAIVQNVFAIILLWARKDLEKLFEETVYNQVKGKKKKQRRKVALGT